MMSGQYTDGSYIGDATDAFFGIVQVKAVVQDGKLTDIQLLQFPNDHETTIQISNRAFPLLTQEAIAVQSAEVDIISGATESSVGFKQSLASALAQAKN